MINKSRTIEHTHTSVFIIDNVRYRGSVTYIMQNLAGVAYYNLNICYTHMVMYAITFLAGHYITLKRHDYIVGKLRYKTSSTYAMVS